MSLLVQICVLVVIISAASAYWIDSNDLPYPDDAASEGIETVSAIKRFQHCMRWGMVCVPDSSFKFTKCCGGLNCVCNIWNSHCRCRAKLG